MAITAEQRNDVISLLVGMFDAAPSAELLTGFVSSIEAGASLESLANDLAVTEEFNSLYPVWLTNEEFATNFVTNLLDGNTSAAALQEGIDFVTALLNGGSSRGDVANTAVSAVLDLGVDDATFGDAAQALINKVEVATYFATTKLDANSDFATLRSVVANVTADSESVTNQKILVDAELDSLMQNLTSGQDFLNGSSGNDAFTAWIFDNQNTLQSGDSINGGLGTDSLMAEVGNSQNFAISAKTNSVENVFFRAQAASTDNSDNDIDDTDGDNGIDQGVQIDAQDMQGVEQLWSVDARANLTIEDVREDSHTVTLGWRNADAGEVNFETYFDTQHITAPGGTTDGSQLFLELLDLEGAAAGEGQLANNPYNGVTFTVDGVEFNIAADAPVTTTYAALVAGLNAELAEAGLTTITASLGETFSKFNSDDGLQYEGTQIVLTNSGPEELAGVGWTTPDGTLPANTNIHTAINAAPPSTTTNLTQVGVIFDNIGRGSKSDDFVAGNISQGSNSGSQGIQQFNVQVDRDSWVDQVRSTNNTLQEVHVDNIGANGSVRIDVLNDVRVFDASGMSGSVNLTADLNTTSVAKYLDLTDTSSNPNADDVNFNYTLGSGNDRLNLDVEEELVGREDFILNAMGGNGDDSITVRVMEDNALAPTADDWYTNQTVGVNVNELNVIGGAGNDTLTVQGGGDYVIEGNAGDDTIIVDNTAAKATWMIGAAAGEAAGYAGTASDVDTESDPIVANVLFKTKLTVSFNGFETTVDVTAGDNYAATQLTLNNAIKQAIANDRVLSDLLSYRDIEGNTMTITSLVDDVIGETAKPVFTLVGTGSAAGGDYNAADVAAFSASEKSAVIAGAGLQSDATDAQIATALNNGIDAFYTGVAASGLHLDADTVEATTLVGAVSTFDNDSEVHADAGDNLIILASDLTSNNTVVFDTTFTKTSIISFEGDNANAAFADILDFTAFLTINQSLSGSTLSETRIATTLNADATTEINSVTIIDGAAAALTTTDNFAGLTTAALLSALNNGGTNYGGLADATLNAQTNAGGVANVVGTTGEAVVLIENTANLGEFKAFQLKFTHDSANNANADYSEATLLGTIDFGSEDITGAGFTVAQLA